MDVAVQEPLALVDRASIRESVLFLAVAAVREVAAQHTMLAENDWLIASAPRLSVVGPSTAWSRSPTKPTCP